MLDWGAGWAGMPTHVQVILSVLIGGISGISSLLKSDKATARDWLPQFISSSVWGFIGFSMTPVLGVEPVISKIGVAAITGWLGSDSINIILSITSKFTNIGPPSGRGGGSSERLSRDEVAPKRDDYLEGAMDDDKHDRSQKPQRKTRLRRRPPLMQKVPVAFSHV